jgi:hypothetical protein
MYVRRIRFEGVIVPAYVCTSHRVDAPDGMDGWVLVDVCKVWTIGGL